MVSKLTKQKQLDPEDANKLDSLVAILNEGLFVEKEIENTGDVTEDSTYHFNFDPNTADFQDLKKLGLSDEISNRIIKYRESGGSFNTKQDLQKIYGLDEEKFRELQPYILLSTINEHEEILPIETNESDIPEEIILLDINTVDSAALTEINGIGEVLSGRIVKFRESLGGFVSMDQLSEVYGIEDYAIENLNERSYVEDDFQPRKISINKLSVEELGKHPYITFDEARLIIAYREQHGEFKQPDDLLGILVLDQDWLKRISPYLEF